MALASSLGIAVGCCGWAEGRAKYFAHFPTVELQSTFYDLPTPELAAKWRAAAPADFRFCIKAWQLITHTPASPTYRRLKRAIDPEQQHLFGAFRATEQVWNAWEKTQEIARRLAAETILFQCPASFVPSPENVGNLRAFLRRVDREGARLAWEPRGAWTDGLIRELCEEFDLIHCVDPFKAKSVYGDAVYWRLHGKASYFYKYADEEIAWLKQQAFEKAAEGRDPIYVLFNNTAMKVDALRLQAELAGTR